MEREEEKQKQQSEYVTRDELNAELTKFAKALREYLEEVVVKRVDDLVKQIKSLKEGNAKWKRKVRKKSRSTRQELK